MKKFWVGGGGGGGGGGGRGLSLPQVCSAIGSGTINMKMQRKRGDIW